MEALAGALATVTGKLPGEALTGNDKLTSESLTTVTNEDEILSESPTNEELESQNPGGFWSANFQGFLNISSRFL